MIAVRDLTFSYPRGAAVFAGFNWEVTRGESWAVLGPSGCGKSTLLSLVAGLLFPTAGSILVADEPLRRPRPHTGLIIQDYGLLPWATVRENAALGLRLRNFYGPDGIHAPRDYQPTLNVDPWLERLGLLEVADRYPAKISGGQRQRTAIARTLALHPDLLLMDEPFSSLDAPTRESMQRLTLELRAEVGLTLVTVTHAIEEAAVLGQRILLFGQAPAREVVVLENPGVGEVDHRESEDFRAVCRELRARMGGVG
jgi:ABC-type nitrate/sulfonate/bicarbonate transport system ATPase subunit